MAKSLRIYALYDGPGGPTAQSTWYGRYSKNLYHVVAYSIKQAVYVTAHKEWSTGGPGLIEYSDATQRWFRSDGSSSWHAVIEVSAARAISKSDVRAALDAKSESEDAE